MVDRNYTKIEEGQEASVRYTGHYLRVDIYEIENEKVFFRNKNVKAGEPTKGYFNRLECSRYLTVIKP